MTTSVDEKAMMKLVDKAVGKPRFTYPMRENAPRPDGTYAAVLLECTENPGYDEVHTEDTTDDEGNPTVKITIVGNRILTFYILFSRDDIEVTVFDNSFYRQDMYELCQELGYSLLEKEPIKPKDVTFESNWEWRTGIKVKLLTNRTQEYTVGNIGTVEVEGATNFEDKEYKTKQTIGGS